GQRPNSIAEYEHEEREMERRATVAESPAPYADGGDMICEGCAGTCKTHTWNNHQQMFLGECCVMPQSDPLPANYAVRQVAILENIAGISTSAAELLDKALAHLRMVRLQSSNGPTLEHVRYAEYLVEQARRIAA